MKCTLGASQHGATPQNESPQEPPSCVPIRGQWRNVPKSVCNWKGKRTKDDEANKTNRHAEKPKQEHDDILVTQQVFSQHCRHSEVRVIEDLLQRYHCQAQRLTIREEPLAFVKREITLPQAAHTPKGNSILDGVRVFVCRLLQPKPRACVSQGQVRLCDPKKKLTTAQSTPWRPSSQWRSLFTAYSSIINVTNSAALFLII